MAGLCVSILMPVRNEARYLPAALTSMQRQTLPNWELVAVDDGSTDATHDILVAAQAADNRIRIIRSSGVGLVAALNAGLQECRAPYIARMDGDDICHPRRLADQAEYLDHHPEVHLVACGFRHFPRSGLKDGMLAYEAWQNTLISHELIMRDLFVESPFIHPSIMVRRELLISMGGYRDKGWPEDYDLWLRMAAANARFARLDSTLLFWRDHPERSTRTMDEYSQNAFRSCKLHHLRQNYLQAVSEVTVAGAGQEGRAWQRLLDAAGIRVARWIDVDPRRIGRELHGAPVCSIETLADNPYPILVAIGVRQARYQFRKVASEYKLREGRDFVCVA